jgi:uncharacterized OB-fold protein
VKHALSEALSRAGVQPDAIDHLLVSGLHGRAVQEAIKASGAPARALTPPHLLQIGNSGVAQFGVQLADALDRAEPRQNIVAIALGDGVTVLVLRTTDALAQHRASHSVASQVTATRPVPYATFLAWRAMLEREPQRRAPASPPFAPPAFRRRDWKFGLVGQRCGTCGSRQLHPGRVCAACGSVDAMTPERIADIPGNVTFQIVDNLAYSPSPPFMMAIVDFEGGGRLRCQLTDVDENWDGVGQSVEMTFRRTHTSQGIHNYFWKARPLRQRVQGGA